MYDITRGNLNEINIPSQQDVGTRPCSDISPYTTPRVKWHGILWRLNYSRHSTANTRTRSKNNNFLQKLASITGSIPSKAEPISFGKYITEFNRLQETTPSGTSDITPVMVKIEALDPEISEIGWRMFNFPWCTG